MNKLPEETSQKFLRYLAYLAFFYFGIRLILLPIVFFNQGTEAFMGILTLIWNFILLIFGLYAAYKLLKMKKWALIAIVILIIIHIISILISSFYLGNTKIPFPQIAILIINLVGFKHFKNIG